MAEPAPKKVYRVAELNRRVREKLELWGEVWVVGEIVDLTRATSGHLYFTLDDGQAPAQLRAVLFRGDALRARARLENGERVQLLGRFSLYEPRGGLQLIARLALPAGDGDRREQLDRLKQKLAKEGLFATDRKRALPRLPRIVGLVTSRQGAALHDFIQVASARAPVRLVLAHCLVQGPEAPRSIVAALRAIARLPGLDVIVVTRGGGASEDLSAFNDEAVARAIAECTIPVVSGVGHEVDSTIADLVADVRAATPSNAAELVVPEAAVLRAELAAYRRHLEQALAMQIGRGRLRLERSSRRVEEPRRTLATARAALSRAGGGLERAMGRRLKRGRAGLATGAERLARHEPRAALARDRAALVALERRLERLGAELLRARAARLGELARAVRAAADPWLGRERARLDAEAARLRPVLEPALARRRARLAQLDHGLRRAPTLGLAAAHARLARLAAQLDALSPLSVLARGYAIALDARTGKAVLRARDLSSGDGLTLRLAEGRVDATVARVHED